MKDIKPLGSLKNIHKILSLLFEIQNQRKAHVFLDIQGHCNWFNIRIFLGGWSSKHEIDYQLDMVYFDDSKSIKQVEQELQNILDTSYNTEELKIIREKELNEIERKQYEKLKAKFEN